MIIIHAVKQIFELTKILSWNLLEHLSSWFKAGPKRRQRGHQYSGAVSMSVLNQWSPFTTWTNELLLNYMPGCPSRMHYLFRQGKSKFHLLEWAGSSDYSSRRVVVCKDSRIGLHGQIMCISGLQKKNHSTGQRNKTKRHNYCLFVSDDVSVHPSDTVHPISKTMPYDFKLPVCYLFLLEK